MFVERDLSAREVMSPSKGRDSKRRFLGRCDGYREWLVGIQSGDSSFVVDFNQSDSRSSVEMAVEVGVVKLGRVGNLILGGFVRSRDVDDCQGGLTREIRGERLDEESANLRRKEKIKKRGSEWSRARSSPRRGVGLRASSS